MKLTMTGRCMDSKEVMAGIEVYAEAQAIIGEKILERGGRLTRDEFDAIFQIGGQRFPITGLAGNSIILGGMIGTQWTKWLDLTQHMCLAGLLHEEFEGDRVVYCIGRDNI